MSETKVERGKRIRAQVIGPLESQPGSTGVKLPEPFVEFSLEFAWGTIWARDVIPIKTRRFVTMALLAAQSRQRELAMHVTSALSNGCTLEEIREVCMHVTCYCGFPTAADALRTVEEVASKIQPPKPL